MSQEIYPEGHGSIKELSGGFRSVMKGLLLVFLSSPHGRHIF